MDEPARWGLAAARPEDPEHRRLIALARKSLEAMAPRPDFSDADVLVADDLLFLPCGFIGSVGALFVPSRSLLIPLGSYVGLDDFLWAYHRGVDLAGATKWDRSNTFTIRAVHDREATLDFLKAIFRRTRGWDVAKQLTNLPAVFENVDLYFSIPDLRSLEDSGACEFEFGGGERKAPDVIRFYSVVGEYGELSNFAERPIVIGKQRWKSSEHYFQAQKFERRKDRQEIRSAKTPMLAARMGRDRRRKLRRDWESTKVGVMREAVAAKFRQHEDLAAMLLETGTAKLVEHTENDSYWGDGGDGSGKNMLGQILMNVRAELAQERPGQLVDRGQIPQNAGRIG